MRRNRKGFTMIELIIVVVIIGVLIALLLPAVNSAMRKARESAIVAEISSLEQGLKSFAAARNLYPPSRFVCSEDGDYSLAALTASGSLRDEIAAGIAGVPYASLSAPQQAAADATIDRLRNRTTESMRAIWPRAQISKVGPQPNIPYLGFYDFNGNGKLDPPYLLTGDECLCFFLGGIPKPTQSTSGDVVFGFLGFARYVRNPFLPDSYVNPSTGVVDIPPRDAATIEFKVAKARDLDGDGVPNYRDNFGGVYAYFCVIGNLYDPGDCDFATEADASPSPRGGFGMQGFGINSYLSSPAPNPYTASRPLPVTGGNYEAADYLPTPTFQSLWVNPTSVQILSPGLDGLYGPGGWWDSFASVTHVPFAPKANQTITGTLLGKDARYVERDNITNFATGRLD